LVAPSPWSRIANPGLNRGQRARRRLDPCDAQPPATGLRRGRREEADAEMEVAPESQSAGSEGSHAVAEVRRDPGPRLRIGLQHRIGLRVARVEDPRRVVLDQHVARRRAVRSLDPQPRAPSIDVEHRWIEAIH
jgi:hypothetical protein